jgi:pyridoxine 5-phosphate synthase
MQRRKLGVNVDHVATLRQARGTLYPQPCTAARICELAGADQITVHLREDRRHIQDADVHQLRESVETILNLELAATPAMLALSCRIKPDRITLVPERRAELTTEGGLDVCAQRSELAAGIGMLREAGIPTSLFIDPDRAQIDAALAIGAQSVELHTGEYSEQTTPEGRAAPLERLRQGAAHAAACGLYVACGHGLHYHNVAELVRIETIAEYNIGHSLVAHAVLVGLDRAVRDMLALLTI